MANIPGTTRAQTIFLRHFRRNPAGPPPGEWPSTVILKRWLQRDAFRQAYDALRANLRHQAEFRLEAAAARAAAQLATPTPNADPKHALDILRIAHSHRRATC
jgi:hypothetical protein